MSGGIAKRRGRAGNRLGKEKAREALALAQELPSRDVRIGDASERLHTGALRPGSIHQHHCDGRVLHHGVQQQLTLDEVRTLGTQRVGQLVVRSHQPAHLILAIRSERHAEIALSIARDHAGKGAKHLRDRPHQAPRQPERGHGRQRRGEEPGPQDAVELLPEPCASRRRRSGQREQR